GVLTEDSLPERKGKEGKGRDILSNPDGSDDALQQVFDYYLAKTERNPKTYDFTVVRKKKGSARLKECLSKTGGDLAKALALMKLAVDGLCASDFHTGHDPKTNGRRYIEWEKHLFGSYEQMERWWNNAPSESPAQTKVNGHGLHAAGAA